MALIDPEWHYSRGNQQFGPVSTGELKRLAISGDLSPADLIWRKEWSEWKRADSLNGLFSEETPRTVRPSPLPQIQAEPLRIPTNTPAKDSKALGSFERIGTVIAGVGKWICIAAAALFCYASLSAQMAPAGAHAAGIACFFGICARLCQAEQMRQ